MAHGPPDPDRALVEEIVGLTRQSGTRMRRLLADTGLPMGPSFCLFALHKSGEVPASQLAKNVGVRGPTMTGLVDTLVREGLVRRRPSADDRRLSLLTVTPKGRRLFQRIQGELLNDWRATLASVPVSKKRAWTDALRELRELAQQLPKREEPA